MENNNFNIKEFRKEFNSGDLYGLEYLENTIIKNYKEQVEKNFNILHYTKEEYIINLFYATKYLNTCNHIYETEKIENNFNWEIYTVVRDKLFQELKITL